MEAKPVTQKTIPFVGGNDHREIFEPCSHPSNGGYLSQHNPAILNRNMEQSHTYLRKHYRLPVTYPVMFAAPMTIGEGTITNLSVFGCTIECVSTPPEVDHLLLRLILPDQRESLPIEGAEVLWIKEKHIGVQFTKVDRAADLRLHGFVWDRMLERLHMLKQQHTLP